MNCIEGWTFTGGSAVWLRCVAPQSEPMWIFNLNAAWSSFAPSLSWLVSRPADTWNSIIIPFIIQNLSDLEYVFRAAMILYNLVTGLPTRLSFILTLTRTLSRQQFKIIPAGSSGQNSSGENVLEVSSKPFLHLAFIISREKDDTGPGVSSLRNWLILYFAKTECDETEETGLMATKIV